ncbi:MAG: nuclear transport factor 2 family protein [Solirubrobacterales bacterium]|nr:nuclear transport factor 2 family protein [Solirubrobacterales bacterium]
MDRGWLERWIDAYERAWRTQGTDSLAELFAAEIEYLPGPFEQPIRGLDALAGFWEAERQSHEERFSFAYEILAVEGSRGVARIDVRYQAPRDQRYLDLWIVESDDDGKCRHFEEWPFWPEQSRAAGD